MPDRRWFAVVICLVACTAHAEDSADTSNPSIDMAGYLQVSLAAAQHRAQRRVSETQFARLAADPATLVLDARSKEKFDELHLRGAINLSFPDMTVDSLQRVLPDKNQRILIYCNNNFSNAQGPFPTKLPSAALNISTYIALYNYGYRNVYELGPLIDIKSSRLEFEGTEKMNKR